MGSSGHDRPCSATMGLLRQAGWTTVIKTFHYKRWRWGECSTCWMPDSGRQVAVPE